MRRKQKSYYQSKASRQITNDAFEENVPHSAQLNRFSEPIFADSLQRFQREIQNSLLLQKQINYYNRKTTRPNKKRAKTQAFDEDSQIAEVVPIKELGKLQNNISELKGQLSLYKKNSHLQDKLDKLVQEMARNRELDRELMMKQQQQHPPVPNNIFYPPQVPYFPQQPYRDRPREDPYDETNYSSKSKSSRPMPMRPKNKLRRLLRKYFFAAAFPIFLRSESKKLALKRKQYLRTFYIQKFNSQMLNLKNWLVETHSYSFPVILEKQKLDLQFWGEKRENIRMEKQNLLMKLVQIGLEKMRQDCTPPKVSFFAQILLNLCGRGSFAMSRFWTATELKSICISEYFGCVRADESLQKFQLGLVVFVKVFIFNMLLQPYKFDSTNFPKQRQPLNNNMHIIASIYYKLCKVVLNEYLQEIRSAIYKLGNWLTVKEEFIVECSEPLVFKEEYPNEDEWITGMLDDQMEELEQHREWAGLLAKVKQVIQALHRQMMKRRREVVRNQKFKIYR